VNLDFLTCSSAGAVPLAESPIAALTAEAGAAFDVRDGWRVPVRYAQPQAEELAVQDSVGWADVSHLPKTELQGDPDSIASLAGGLSRGTAVRASGGWWCQLTASRAIVLGAASLQTNATVWALEVTAQFVALRLGGPAARDTIARFCALDLRPTVAPPGAFRPGAVARTPGFVLCEGPDRYLLLVGAALGEYLWTVVSDAGARLGGRPVGVDVLADHDVALEEAADRA
jgi:glycine cleavage system aminomethyltransferase T